MSITEEQYKFCIDEGLVLTPVNPNTKKPKAVYQGNHNLDGSKNTVKNLAGLVSAKNFITENG